MTEIENSAIKNGILAYGLIKNGEIVRDDELNKLADGTCSLFISLKFAHSNREWIGWFKKCLNVNPNLKLESIVIAYSEDDIAGNYSVSTVRKILRTIKSQCDECRLISIGNTSAENTNDDAIFYFNDKTKEMAGTAKQCCPNALIAMLDFEQNEDVLNATSLDGIAKNNLMIDEKKIKRAKEKIKQIAALIQSKTNSPYEQHLLTLHYISQYVYTLDDENQLASISRNISDIILNNAKYICCAGYARLYTEIMREMGFEVKTQSADSHLRAKVLLQDKKYNINGVYFVEPTWLSREENENLPIFNFNKYCNISLKLIRDSYKRSSVEDYVGKGIIKASKRDNYLFEQLRNDLSKRTFYSLKDLNDFLDAEFLEKRQEVYLYVKKKIKEMNFLDNKKIIGSEVVDFLDNSNFAENMKINKNLESFLGKSESEREKQIQEFFKKLYSSYKEERFKDVFDVQDFLRDKAIDEGLPKEIVKPAFNLQDILGFGFNEKYIDATSISNDKEKIFKLIYRHAKEVARKGKIIIRKAERLIKKDDKEVFKNVASDENYDTKKEFKKLTENFTSLSNKNFAKILESTNEIKDETLMKAVVQIKALIKPEDYNLFLQDKSNDAEHEDIARVEF